jgi:hypothetical protein
MMPAAWIIVGVLLAVVLLAMDVQRPGACLMIIAGAVLGPFMVFLIIWRAWLVVWQGRVDRQRPCKGRVELSDR